MEEGGLDMMKYLCIKHDDKCPVCGAKIIHINQLRCDKCNTDFCWIKDNPYYCPYCKSAEGGSEDENLYL